MGGNWDIVGYQPGLPPSEDRDKVSIHHFGSGTQDVLAVIQWCCSSVPTSCPTLCDPRSAARQASLSITNSQTCSNSSPPGWWRHPTISCSVAPFSCCLQYCPASGSFPMSQLFTSGGQSMGASASASVLPVNIQGWFPLGWTGWISLQAKGLIQ